MQKNLHIESPHWYIPRISVCISIKLHPKYYTSLYYVFFLNVWCGGRRCCIQVTCCGVAWQLAPIFLLQKRVALCCLILLLGSMSLHLPVHISAQGWCETNRCTNTIQCLILRFEHLTGLKAHVRDNCNYAATYPFPFWPCQTACWPNFLERYLHLR